jgi:hypothetical protein
MVIRGRQSKVFVTCPFGHGTSIAQRKFLEIAGEVITNFIFTEGYKIFSDFSDVLGSLDLSFFPRA